MVLEPPNADTVILTTNKQASHLDLGDLNVNFNF
jgi:hypothetical protein